jgi:hypothetical protein
MAATTAAAEVQYKLVWSVLPEFLAATKAAVFAAGAGTWEGGKYVQVSLISYASHVLVFQYLGRWVLQHAWTNSGWTAFVISSFPPPFFFFNS